VVDAGKVRVAVRVLRALVLAAGVALGVAKVAGVARAHAAVAGRAVVGVGTTWVGLARITGRALVTLPKRISFIRCPALADGPVVEGVAVGVLSAGLDASIDALLIEARLVRRAVVMTDALGSASGRGTNVSGQT
jgi:hypothetical protein